MQSSFRETADFLKALSADVEYCYDKFESEDSQFWRRTFIRAMFAFAEGFIFRMKQSAIDIHNLEGNLFAEAELVFLKEEDTREFILNRKGDTETQSKKRLIAFENNFRFAFKAYARAFNPTYALDLGDDGWAAFREALDIRHRLTHPKFINQLDISDDEFQRIEKGMTWFRQVTQDIHNSRNNAT